MKIYIALQYFVKSVISDFIKILLRVLKFLLYIDGRTDRPNLIGAQKGGEHDPKNQIVLSCFLSSFRLLNRSKYFWLLCTLYDYCRVNKSW
jgi:hypothetical protein